MKKVYFILITTTIINITNAQNPIPNPSFNTSWWPADYPSGWTDSRDIQQASPGYGGAGWCAWAIKQAATYPAFVTSVAGNGISISAAYTSFSLYYKFTSVSADMLIINVTINNASNVQIGSGVTQIFTSVGNWTALTIPINYSGTGPAEAIISVVMNPTSGSNPHVGSQFYIDDMVLNGATAVNDIEIESSSLRIFPNPAADFVQIKAESFNQKPANIQIMDANGRIVREINTADISDNFTMLLNNLPVGNYIVAVRNDEMLSTKRLVVK